MTKKTNGKKREWTKQDVSELRRHSKMKTEVRAISKGMKRTQGALRQKAFALGLSLGHQR